MLEQGQSRRSDDELSRSLVLVIRRKGGGREGASVKTANPREALI